MAHLVGHERAAGAAALGPLGHAGLEEEAVDDQLAAAVEQVVQARGSVRPLEAVLLLHRQPRHPAPLGGQGVAGAGELLLLHEQGLACGGPLLGRDDRWGVHRRVLLLQIVVDGVEQAPPQGALAIHPVGRLAEHVGLERELVRAADDLAPQDAGLLQHLQVLRDGGLRDSEARRGVADPRGARGQALDDPASDRMRERLERIVHHMVNRSTSRRAPDQLGDVETRSGSGCAGRTSATSPTRRSPRPRARRSSRRVIALDDLAAPGGSRPYPCHSNMIVAPSSVSITARKSGEALALPRVVRAAERPLIEPSQRPSARNRCCSQPPSRPTVQLSG